MTKHGNGAHAGQRGDKGSADMSADLHRGEREFAPREESHGFSGKRGKRGETAAEPRDDEQPPLG